MYLKKRLIVVWKRCKMANVGETYRQLGNRFVEHNEASQMERIVQTGNIFVKPNPELKTWSNCPVEKKKFLEQRAISFLGTAKSFGMNVKIHII